MDDASGLSSTVVHIRFNKDNLNYPLQKSPNTILEPAYVPIGTKELRVTCVICPNGYWPECKISLYGKNMTRKEIDFKGNGENSSYLIEGYETFHVGIFPWPTDQQSFSFDLEFVGGDDMK